MTVVERAQHCRSRIRLPRIANALVCVVETAHGAKIGGVLECGYRSILRVRRQGRPKPGPVRIKVEAG